MKALSALAMWNSLSRTSSRIVAARLEQSGDLPGIGFKSGGILLGEIEHAQPFEFSAGDLEDLVERGDLCPR